MLTRSSDGTVRAALWARVRELDRPCVRLAGRRLQPAALAALLLVVVAVTAHRSHWISGYLERLGTDRIASGDNGLGRDYALNVWIPTHALLAHRVPYDPADTAVRAHYHANLQAGLYTPSILTMLLPMTVLPLPQAAEAMYALNMIMIWLALLVLIRPRSPARCVLVASLGVVTFNGWSGESGLLYGQPIGFLVLGLALVAHDMMRGRFGVPSSAGVVLLATKPQFAAPVLVVLAALRAWRPIAVGLGITAVAALPFAALFVGAAGGLSAALSVVRRAADYAAAAYTGSGRSDLLVLLTGGDPGRWGSRALILQFAVLAAGAAAATAVGRARAGRRAIGLVAVVVGLDLLCVYHEWYDLAAAVVPAALVLAAPRRRWREAPLVAFASVAYVVVDLCARGSLRFRLEMSGAAGYWLWAHLDRYWPPIVGAALLAAGTLSVVRPPRRDLEPEPLSP